MTKAIYARVFQLLTGREAQVRPSTDGRTDPEIVRNLFTANDAEFTADCEAGYRSALTGALAELQPQLMRDGFPLPGVLAALAEVSRIPGVVQSALDREHPPQRRGQAGPAGRPPAAARPGRRRLRV